MVLTRVAPPALDLVVMDGYRKIGSDRGATKKPVANNTSSRSVDFNSVDDLDQRLWNCIDVVNLNGFSLNITQYA